jgi:glycosyltransferase involved in cell wall biosynthesis
MRILQVNSALQLGGGETHVVELTQALRQHGHQVIVTGRPRGAVQPDFTLPFRNALDLPTVARLRRLIRRERFDVVHAHLARDYPLAAAATWGMPPVLVLTRHLLYPVKSHVLYRRVDGWIAPTAQILSSLKRLKPRASTVIPNWVDLSKFSFLPHPLHAPLNLGILGQISPHKGHDDALEALRLLGPGYQLLIAGKGEDSYVQSLRSLSDGLPVRFLGFVSLPEFFKNVDILLVPSWEEPFGIVLLEAMASGIPVVATAAGGPLDIVRHGIDGFLVPPRNPRALAEAVRALQSRTESIVLEARKRVESTFDIQAVVPRVEAFYRSLAHL